MEKILERSETCEEENVDVGMRGNVIGLVKDGYNGVIYISVEDIMPNRGQPRKSFEVGSLVELSESIKAAIKNLPPRERELIECKFYKEMKLQELAEEFGISSSRITRIIQSGLNKLKKELQRKGFKLT